MPRNAFNRRALLSLPLVLPLALALPASQAQPAPVRQALIEGL